MQKHVLSYCREIRCHLRYETIALPSPPPSMKAVPSPYPLAMSNCTLPSLSPILKPAPRLLASVNSFFSYKYHSISTKVHSFFAQYISCLYLALSLNCLLPFLSSYDPCLSTLDLHLLPSPLHSPFPHFTPCLL